MDPASREQKMDMVGGGKGSAEAQERFHTPPVTYVVPGNGLMNSRDGRVGF